jgi:hypothetical protein
MRWGFLTPDGLDYSIGLQDRSRMMQGLNLNIHKLCAPTKETGFLSNLRAATNIVVKNPVSRLPRTNLNFSLQSSFRGLLL